MAILTHIIGMITICSMLYTTYPQYLCINNEIQWKTQITVGEKSITKKLDYLKEDIKVPQLLDSKEDEKIKFINDTIIKDIMPKVEEAEKTSKEYFKGLEKVKHTFPYEIYSRYTVTEDNDSLISLYNDYYEYLGGAHGMTTKTSYTIDKKQEKLLKLKDLFVEGYNYMDIINSKIKEEISNHTENYFDSGNVFKGINENQSFYIEGDDLVIYYQLYDLAPYVYGFPQFKIPVKLFDKNFIYS